MKNYPELSASASNIIIPATEKPHIATAGIFIIKEGKDGPGVHSDKYTELLLHSTYDGMSSGSISIPVSLYNELPNKEICGQKRDDPSMKQGMTTCMLPKHLSSSPFIEKLRNDKVTHLVLLLGSMIKTEGEREVTWGLAGGYGGAAPAFTTETFVTHKFSVRSRVYDVNTGSLLSDAQISDEDEGSYGVMVMIMPYRINVDDDAYIKLIGKRIGEELGRRFIHEKARR